MRCITNSGPNHRPRWTAIVVLILIAVGGCTHGNGSSKSETPAQRSAALNRRIEQALAEQPPKAPPSYGSLYDERGAFGDMFVDAKARRIGDILTIKIVESSSATNKAGTTTDRNSELSAGMTSFLGVENNYAPNSPFLNPFSKIAGSLDSEFEGTGTTQRSGDLTAYMTARIVDVMANGNFFIEGNREVQVNDENQIITLSGIVRPRDISSQNIIQSTYIADAQISYRGSGILNNRQKPGWFTQIMDKVWPF